MLISAKSNKQMQKMAYLQDHNNDISTMALQFFFKKFKAQALLRQAQS